MNPSISCSEHPMRYSTTLIAEFIIGHSVSHIPWVGTLALGRCNTGLFTNAAAQSLRNVFPYGVSMVAVHPAFPLFEVYGIRRQVPMYNRVAVPVKIQAFLSHRGSCQNERPERRVERATHGVDMVSGLRIVTDCAVIGVTASEMLMHRIRPSLHSGGTWVPLYDVQPSCRQLEYFAQRSNQI